jgi:SsrA-binding protein
MSKKKEEIQKTLSLHNRKASHEYYFLEKYTAGIILKGTEIKSLRQSKVNWQDAFGMFQEDGLWLKQMNISQYTEGTYNNHDPERPKKLLLKKRELKKIREKSQENGIAIIPIHIFINDKGLFKVEIAVAKGKKLVDKRDSEKEKDAKREIDREML